MLLRFNQTSIWFCALCLLNLGHIGFLFGQEKPAVARPNRSPLISVRDDLGRPVILKAQARRVVSLAPHLTEILFALAAGDRIVGTTEYADYPPAARDIERIASAQSIDIERIHALKPDLIIAWRSGGAVAAVEELQRLGYPIFWSEPTEVPMVATTLERLAILLGQEQEGRQQAASFRQRYQVLRQQYAHRKMVPVFYQLWAQPLITVGGQQIISQAIQICGAQNIFAALTAPSPTVQMEAVLQADPELIVVSGEKQLAYSWLESWRSWPRLKAVRQGNLIAFPPDLLDRMGPRLLLGIEKFCAVVEEARIKRRGSVR